MSTKPLLFRSRSKTHCPEFVKECKNSVRASEGKVRVAETRTDARSVIERVRQSTAKASVKSNRSDSAMDNSVPFGSSMDASICRRYNLAKREIEESMTDRGASMTR